MGSDAGVEQERLDGQIAAALRVVRSGPVATVTLDRPRKANAITVAMWRQLAAELAPLAADPSLRALIVTGTGCFSAGADISEFDALAGDADRSRAYEALVEAGLAAVRDFPRPTIAAITRHCLGGGLALAAACDFRVADASARFAVPAARLGIVYGAPLCAQLVAVVGVVNAKRILFGAETFDGAAAARMGLVDLVEDGTVPAAAAALAQRFVDRAPLSLAGMKTIVNLVAAGGVEAGAAEIAAAVAAAADSRDYREAIAAFAEKRVPVFKGL